MIYNITSNRWDDGILKLFKIPKHILPKVKDCSDDYGYTHHSITGKPIPINGRKLFLGYSFFSFTHKFITLIILYIKKIGPVKILSWCPVVIVNVDSFDKRFMLFKTFLWSISEY